MRRNTTRSSDVLLERQCAEGRMLKVLAWIVGIIFVIGLLVIFGVFDLIF